MVRHTFLLSESVACANVCRSSGTKNRKLHQQRSLLMYFFQHLWKKLCKTPLLAAAVSFVSLLF